MPFVEIVPIGYRGRIGLFMSVTKKYISISGTIVKKLKRVNILLDRKNKLIAFKEIKEGRYSIYSTGSGHAMTCTLLNKIMRGKIELKYNTEKDMYIGSYKDIAIDAKD